MPKIPLVRVHEKTYKEIGDPEWKSVSDVIHTDSVRVSNKSLPIFILPDGIYTFPNSVDHMPYIFKEKHEFINIDRGVMINTAYAVGINEEHKALVINDAKGGIINLKIAGGKLGFVREYFRMFLSK